jgi:hypothetical protein
VSWISTGSFAITRLGVLDTPATIHTAADRMAVKPGLVDTAVHKRGHIPADHIEAAEKNLAGLVYFDKGP